MHALVGALIALHERERSGRGQIVDVALTESLITMLESVIPEYGYLGMIRERTGNIAHNSAPTNAYACADGALVCIAANTTRLFRTLFRAIGREDYADDPDLGDATRVASGAPDELDAVIADWTGTRTARRGRRRSCASISSRSAGSTASPTSPPTPSSSPAR